MLWSIDDLLLPTWVSAYLLPNQSGIQALNHLRLPAFISFSFPYHRQPQNVSRYKILLHSYTQTIESNSLVSGKSIKYSVLKLHCIKTSRKLTDLHRLYVFPFEPFLGWVFFSLRICYLQLWKPTITIEGCERYPYFQTLDLASDRMVLNGITVTNDERAYDTKSY